MLVVLLLSLRTFMDESVENEECVPSSLGVLCIGAILFLPQCVYLVC